MLRTTVFFVAGILLLLLAGTTLAQDVKVDYDNTFDFKTLKDVFRPSLELPGGILSVRNVSSAKWKRL